MSRFISALAGRVWVAVVGVATIVGAIPVLFAGDGWPWSLFSRTVLAVVAVILFAVVFLLNELLRSARAARAKSDAALITLTQDLAAERERNAAPRPNDVELMASVCQLFPLRRSLASWLDAFDSKFWSDARQKDAVHFQAETENTHFLNKDVEVAWVNLRAAMGLLISWMYSYGVSDLSGRVAFDLERFPYRESEIARDKGAELAEETFTARIRFSEVATEAGLLEVSPEGVL